MSFNVKNILIVIVSIFALSGTTFAQKGKRKANNEMNEWRYEVEATKTAAQGTAQIKIWTYSKNQETAIMQAKKNAVHAIIFKGVPKNGRVQGQKPLARNPNLEQEKKEFFKEFFKDGGKFQKYVFLVNNGAIALGDRIKISKKEYKIGVVVSVNVAGLRKDLENAGVIKGLSNGF